MRANRGLGAAATRSPPTAALSGCHGDASGTSGPDSRFPDSFLRRLSCESEGSPTLIAPLPERRGLLTAPKYGANRLRFVGKDAPLPGGNKAGGGKRLHAFPATSPQISAVFSADLSAGGNVSALFHSDRRGDVPTPSQ